MRRTSFGHNLQAMHVARELGNRNSARALQTRANVDAVGRTLAKKNLLTNFTTHAQKQLVQDGKIKIAIIDDFSVNTRHSEGVRRRLVANVPGGLRNKIKFIAYDVGGLDKAGIARLIKQAGLDAQQKKFVALSIGDGLKTYDKNEIERRLGAPIDRHNAARAARYIAETYGLTAAELDAWREIGRASYEVLVATPVWNDGKTTLAALHSAFNNGVVTSLNGGGGDATRIPGIVDVYMPKQDLFNQKSSQSAPTFIGQALQVVFSNGHYY
jgi:hypothetical protein